MRYQASAPDCIFQAVSFIGVFSIAWVSYPVSGKTLLNREIQ